MYLWEVLRCTRRNPEAWVREKIPLIAATVTDATDFLERVISNSDRPRSHGGTTKPAPQAGTEAGNMSAEKLGDLIGMRLARGIDADGCATTVGAKKCGHAAGAQVRRRDGGDRDHVPERKALRADDRRGNPYIHLGGRGVRRDEWCERPL